MPAEVYLYIELLFAGAIMLGILFFNSIFLYKQKITDRISMMLLFSVVMSLSELIWTFCEEYTNIKAVVFIAVISYIISFSLFASFLNRYLIERFITRLNKTKIFIFYRVPLILLGLFCMTSPMTRLFIWVDETGHANFGPIAYYYFYFLMMIYLYSPLIIGLCLLILGKHRKSAKGESFVTMFIFSAMSPTLCLLQTLFLPDKYTNLTVPVALALVYFITNESTRNALDAQAHIEAVEADLRIASKIQLDALPPLAPEFTDHLDLSLRGSMNTAKEVGGDFFDYFPIGDNRICFLIADVSGKGTPAALFMMTAKTMIKDFALILDSTSEIFTAVNARLCESNEAGMFATAWIGILDTQTMALQYTNAGHNYPVLQRKGQPCEMIKKVHGLFLGGMEFTQYRQADIQLEPGDRLLLYTDGVVEAHNKDDELYGDDRLISMLDSTRDLQSEQVLERIFEDVNEFATGVPQFDDITMVILCMKE